MRHVLNMYFWLFDMTKFTSLIISEKQSMIIWLIINNQDY